MPSIITVANQKGGVGKTTTTRHLAYFLGTYHIRTLVIDNDHQGNLTQYFGLNPVELDADRGTMYHVIAEERPLRDILVPVSKSITVAPSSLSLAEAGARLVLQADVNGVLKAALAEVQNDFDVVLIDCGPNLERLLINALVASRYVLIPTKTDSMSVSGIPALVQTISKVRRMNPALEVLGVLPTIYHAGRQADEGAMENLRSSADAAGVRLFAPIPAATNYDKAAGLQRSVFEAFPLTPGREEYEKLAEVIIAL